MGETKARVWKKIGIFYIITWVLSTPFNLFMIFAGDILSGGMLYMAGLMWSPAVAAIVTKKLFGESLRDLGWGWGKHRYQLLSYALPLFYALPVYLLAWVSGLGKLDLDGYTVRAVGGLGLSTWSPGIIVALFVVLNATLGLVDSTSRALGEEIGWRGFLVPELNKVVGIPGVGLISGALWAVWHFPLMLTVDYGVDTPKWYGFACFTGMIVGCSFILAWLRLRSGSLWTAAILHGSHNRLIFGIFAPLTANAGITGYVAGEYGIGLVATTAAAAVILWRFWPVTQEKERP